MNHITLRVRRSFNEGAKLQMTRKLQLIIVAAMLIAATEHINASKGEVAPNHQKVVADQVTKIRQKTPTISELQAQEQLLKTYTDLANNPKANDQQKATFQPRIDILNQKIAQNNSLNLGNLTTDNTLPETEISFTPDVLNQDNVSAKDGTMNSSAQKKSETQRKNAKNRRY